MKNRNGFVSDDLLLAGREDQHSDATGRRTDDARIGGVCSVIEFDAEPRETLAHGSPNLRLVLAYPGGEYEAVEATKRGRKPCCFACDPKRKEFERFACFRPRTGGKFTAVRADPGDTEQTGLLIQQFFDRACAHALLFDQVKEHARIECAAAR